MIDRLTVLSHDDLTEQRFVLTGRTLGIGLDEKHQFLGVFGDWQFAFFSSNASGQAVENHPRVSVKCFVLIDFANDRLPDVFDAIDDGVQGKPSADLYLDDKALCLGYGAYGVDWGEVITMYGEINGA